MTKKCAACACELEIDDDGTTDLPSGWYLRCIDETDYILCDVCGAQIHFRGGISPYLMEMLNLMDGAMCDVSADVAQSREGRRRQRKRS